LSDRWRGCAPFVLFLLLVSHTSLGAVPEYELKAALIYKVGKFVRWPEGTFAVAGGTLRVCVAGNDDFGASIDSLAGRKLLGQIIAIERLPNGESAKACHVVFVSRSERERLPALLSTIARDPVLTISDIDGFAAQGGIVGLVTTASKIHFEINSAASRRAGLEIGAQLLQLATLIAEQPRTEQAKADQARADSTGAGVYGADQRSPDSHGPDPHSPDSHSPDPHSAEKP
jgi:hypothetical protein